MKKFLYAILFVSICSICAMEKQDGQETKRQKIETAENTSLQVTPRSTESLSNLCINELVLQPHDPQNVVRCLQLDILMNAFENIPLGLALPILIKSDQTIINTYNNQLIALLKTNCHEILHYFIISRLMGDRICMDSLMENIFYNPQISLNIKFEIIRYLQGENTIDAAIWLLANEGPITDSDILSALAILLSPEQKILTLRKQFIPDMSSNNIDLSNALKRYQADLIVVYTKSYFKAEETTLLHLKQFETFIALECKEPNIIKSLWNYCKNSSHFISIIKQYKQHIKSKHAAIDENIELKNEWESGSKNSQIISYEYLRLSIEEFLQEDLPDEIKKKLTQCINLLNNVNTRALQEMCKPFAENINKELMAFMAKIFKEKHCKPIQFHSFRQGILTVMAFMRDAHNELRAFTRLYCKKRGIAIDSDQSLSAVKELLQRIFHDELEQWEREKLIDVWKLIARIRDITWDGLK